MVEPSNPEEYELVPKNQLEYLQHEVEKVKHNPFGDTRSSKDLLSAMDALNRNVTKLVHIFETANDEIVRDYKDQTSSEKLNRVLEQNEKLAKGIVAMADLLKEMKGTRVALEEVPGRPGPQDATAQPDGNQWMNATPKNTELKNPFLEKGQVPISPDVRTQGMPPPGITQQQGGMQQPMTQGADEIQGGMQPPPGRPQGKLPPIDFSDIPPPPK